MEDMTRDQQLLAEFKEGLDKDGPIVLAQRVAALEGENAALIAAQIGLEDDGLRAIERTDELKQQLETVTAERDAAIERADKAEAGEKKAKAEIRKASTPARLRKIAVLDDGKALHGEDLQKAIADADEVVIAFSDGQREVAGVSPIEVTGDAWRPHHFGLLLNTPVELLGPNDGPSASIDGYALLLDGKQVAYCQRPQPLQLAAGQRINLAGDIIFK